MPEVKRVKLPIDPYLPAIVAAYRENDALILEASPGSGKTTRVPVALLSVIEPQQKILILEPRRIAAKLSARRVAVELGESPGGSVGYQFRFERVLGPRTRLVFLTEGMLLRLLLTDPELKGVAAVVLDEFHERHLHSDIALGYLRRLQKGRRQDLKLVIMSATLETESLERFLRRENKTVKTIRIDAPRFPVEVRYLPSAPAKRLGDTVAEGVRAVAGFGPSGDILVFLPGMAEIRWAEEALQRNGPLGFSTIPLHGDLSVEEQDRALRPGGGRKIILSTNLAETSITIEGVSAVVDSGLHRQASHSWWSGIPALRTRPISKSSAIQRAGRAGRTGPGICLRLYTQGDFDGRAPFDKPEIERADLTQPVLELISLGVENPISFEWFEAPPRNSLEASMALIELLGLADSDEAKESWRLTHDGRSAVRLPVHPRLARFLMAMLAFSRIRTGVDVASRIQEGGFSGNGNLDFLASLSDDSWKKDPAVRKTSERLLALLPEERVPSVNEPRSGAEPDLMKSLLAAYPDRVAKKRVTSSAYEEKVELLFSGGGGAWIPNQAWLQREEWFLVVDAREKKRLNQMQSEIEVAALCPIRADWLLDVGGRLLREREVLIWDSQRASVSAACQLQYGELVLSEDRSRPSNRVAATELLLSKGLGIDSSSIHHAALPAFVHALSARLKVEELESVLVRLSLIREMSPETGVPEITPIWLMTVFADLAGYEFSLSGIQDADLSLSVLNRLEPAFTRTIEVLAPTSLLLPSGRKAKVRYRFGQKPWVESRLQDFFGMRKGPAIIGGRVPLLLHLLAPNQRPVQVTQDLESFWKNTYSEVRRELSRRYPRHKWPEDPTVFFKE